MIDGIEKYVEEFNNENNQKVSKFGIINRALLMSNVNDYQLLYYFYPMIERLVRCILNQSGFFDLENRNQYTFKTLNSILTQNRDQLKEVFGGEGEEILYYLNDIYAEDGLRNKIMHYIDMEIDSSAVIAARYIFEWLIKFYIDKFSI